MPNNEEKLTLTASSFDIEDKPSTSAFFERVVQVIEQSRRFVGYTLDLTMCVAYFEIGRIIVEEEQDGKARAEYGTGLLAGLSSFLKERIGKGIRSLTLEMQENFTKYMLRQFGKQCLPNLETAIK